MRAQYGQEGSVNQKMDKRVAQALQEADMYQTVVAYTFERNSNGDQVIRAEIVVTSDMLQTIMGSAEKVEVDISSVHHEIVGDEGK